MPNPNITSGILSGFSLSLITVAWLVGAGARQDRADAAVVMQPATQPIQLALPAERVEGLGQAPDAARTAVIVHPAVGGDISLPVIADTFLWKESKNSSGTGAGILLRDNRFSQGLVKIDPQAVDASAQFTASFHLKVGGVERKALPATLSLHRVLTDWSEDATWFSPQPDQDRAWNGLKPGTDYEAKPLAQWQTQSLTDNQVIDIDGLGTAVKAWRSGEWPNYGFLVLLNGKAVQCSFPSREKSTGAHALALGGTAALLVAPNAGVLAKVLMTPESLVDADLRLSVRKPAKAVKGATQASLSIEVLRALRPIADHPLVAGADFDASPVATCNVAAPAPAAESTITIPGLGDVLRHIAAGEWKNDGLIVRVTTAGAVVGLSNGAPALAIAGPNDARNAPAFTITLKPAAHALLYSNDMQPRPGVFTTLKNGHLHYGDRRLRLWGTVGEPHADRLVKMGFNAERLWEPRVNLNKNAPGFYTEESLKRGEPATYTKGDGSLMDRWDQHFADDKAHGIFIMLAALQNGMPVIPLAADDSFIAPGHDPGSNAADWDAWKKAVLTPKVEPMLAKIEVIDGRLLAIRKRAAKNLLRHLNPYTGKPCGEDEAIAVYEVFNENGFPRAVLEGEYEKWPAFFQEEFRQKWNNWLKLKYGDEAALIAAWDKLDAGESLGGNGTVKLGPTLQNRASSSAARAGDFVRFVIETDHHFHEEFRGHCRTLAPPGVGVNVAPFSFDTQYRPHLAWNYTNSLAEVNCFGMYFWDLNSSLTKPPSAYVIDSNTTEGSATILYETNCSRPDPYRAEYPIKCAALADWQDWDGVFWHYWSPNDEPDESYLTTPMAPPVASHYWTAVQHQNDPVMCSAMSIAGRLFLDYHIHPAPKPAIFEVGAKALFGYDHYAGVGNAQQTFTRGARVRFEPDKPTDLVVDGASPPQPQLITGAVASGDEILWDWPNGRLIIDSPTAKAYVGKVAGPFKFKDGIVLGEVSTPFVSFAMASGDGKPLTGPDASKKIYITAVADARNTDFKFNYAVKGGPLEQAGAVSNRGRAPVIVDRVNYTVWFPTKLDGTFSDYDFALRPAASQTLADTNKLTRSGATPYMSVLSIDRRGGPAAVPEIPAVAVTENDKVAGSSAAPAPLTTAPTGPWNPVSVLSWNMGYAAAHRALRDSKLAYSSISKQDLANAPSITLSDAQLPTLWNSPADLELSFAEDHLRSITATFKQPPPFDSAVADFQKKFGAPVEKQAGAQFERSLARWEKVDQTVNIAMTESQGILKIVFDSSAAGALTGGAPRATENRR